jgi:hypothetical protein
MSWAIRCDQSTPKVRAIWVTGFSSAAAKRTNWFINTASVGAALTGSAGILADGWLWAEIAGKDAGAPDGTAFVYFVTRNSA